MLQFHQTQVNLLPRAFKESYLFRLGVSMWQTCLTIVRVLFLPTSVYEGIAKAGVGVLVFFSTLFGVFSLAAMIQNNMQWFPDLIDFNDTSTSFFIDHAKVISPVETFMLALANPFVEQISTVELMRPATTSPANTFHQATDNICLTDAEPWPIVPKYAFCDADMLGLTMFDYALLAEVAYFDDKGMDVVLRQWHFVCVDIHHAKTTSSKQSWTDCFLIHLR